MKTVKSFGEYIAMRRMDNSMSITKLASKLNLNSSFVSKIENGWRSFPKERLSELAGIFNRPIEEVENHFLFTDLKIKYGDFKNYRERITEILTEKEPNENLLEIIKGGESKSVEFKSTLRFCLKNLKPEKIIEYSAIKNISAFLNTNGGKLFIGIDDNGKILGLEKTDFETFKEENKTDAFLKHLDNLISKYFGNHFTRNFEISFKNIKNKTIAIIDILPNNQGPTIIKNFGNNGQDTFYVRRNASVIALDMKDFFSYSKERWK